MVQVTRFQFVMMISLVGLVFAGISSVSACQWPVSGGPLNQPVPQYRPGAPSGGSLATPRAASPTPARQPTRVQAPPASVSVPNRYPLGPAVNPTSKPALRPDNGRATNATPAMPALPNVNSAAAAAPKQTAKKAAQKKHQTPLVSYDIYRDRNPLPIDPRKPCGPCTNPACLGGCCQAPGLNGRPYQEREPGGCRCGDKKLGKNKPMFSVYWPRPFSAKLEESCAGKSCRGCRSCQKDPLVDVFDRFIDFKPINYQRKDNGYCGEDSDPYGCLGESRMIASGVAGVGYRFPSVPVDRSAAKDSFRIR